LTLLAAVRRTMLMPAIDVIGKDPVNAGKAEELGTLRRIVHLIGGTRAFQRLLSVRFQV